MLDLRRTKTRTEMQHGGSLGAQMNVGPVTSPAISGKTQSPGSPPSCSSSTALGRRLLLRFDELSQASSPGEVERCRFEDDLDFLSPLNESFIDLGCGRPREARERWRQPQIVRACPSALAHLGRHDRQDVCRAMTANRELEAEAKVWYVGSELNRSRQPTKDLSRNRAALSTATPTCQTPLSSFSFPV